MLGAFIGGAGAGMVALAKVTPREPAPCPGCVAEPDHRLVREDRYIWSGRELTSYVYAPFCQVCGKRLDLAAAEEALAEALRSGDGQRILEAMMDLRETTGGGTDYLEISDRVVDDEIRQRGPVDAARPSTTATWPLFRTRRAW
jgi:hypothetical protein